MHIGKLLSPLLFFFRKLFGQHLPDTEALDRSIPYRVKYLHICFSLALHTANSYESHYSDYIPINFSLVFISYYP